VSEKLQKNTKETKEKDVQEGIESEVKSEDAQAPVKETKEKGKKHITASVDLAALPNLFLTETKGKAAQVKNIDHIKDLINQEEEKLNETGEYPHDYLYNQTVRALDDIVEGKEHDSSGFTENQKKLILMKFGKWAAEGYDMGRREDITSGKVVTVEEFLNTMRQRKKLRFFIEKAVYDHLMKQDLTTDPYVPLEEDRGSPEAEEMIKSIAKEFGLDEEEVRKMWMESEDNEAFRTALNQKYFTSGVCRDIAVFQAKLAHDMGMKNTFITNSSWEGKAHVVSGFRDESGNIVFLNYSVMIPTDTPNMKMALKYLEDNQKSIALQYLMSKGEDEGRKMVRVKSEAAETIEEIARGTPKKIEEQMDDVLERGLHLKETGLDFAIEKNKVALELDLNTIAGSTMLTTTFHNLQDREANAINQALSARLGHEVGNEWIQAGLGAAYSHIELKAQEGDARAKLNKFFANLYVKTHKDFEITDKVHYQIGAIADAIIDIGLDEGSFSSAQLEMATGQRLSYITPNLELFVGLQSKHALVPSNVQKSSLNPKVYDMTQDLLAANLGVDVGLGTYSGYQVRLGAMGQVGTKYLGLATEYKGKVRLTAEAEDSGGYIEGRGSYTDSGDFRIPEEAEMEASLGYRREALGGMMEINGFAFKDVSLGEFKDPRLDDFGFGFRVKYEF